MSTPTPTPDITTELMQDVAKTAEAVFAAVLAQRTNANTAASDAASAVADAVKAAKDGIGAIPNLPAFAAMFLENDSVLTPLVTNLISMLESTASAALNKVEGK